MNNFWSYLKIEDNISFDFALNCAKSDKNSLSVIGLIGLILGD